jgi:hypothetical protein
VFEGEVDIGHRLSLDPLDGVDDEKRAFAGGEAAADLVGEVDVPGGIDQVELVFAPIGHRSCHLQESVGQRRLAMVDVGNDAEVSDVGRGGQLGHGRGGTLGFHDWRSKRLARNGPGRRMRQPRPGNCLQYSQSRLAAMPQDTYFMTWLPFRGMHPGAVCIVQP